MTLLLIENEYGYRRLDKKDVSPAVPYGFGLSYTTFEISGQKCSVENGMVKAEAKVANTGNIAGTEVIQLYIGKVNSEIDRPVKELKGFRRVTLAPGESCNIAITCPYQKLGYYCEKDKTWKTEIGKYNAYIGNCCSKGFLYKCDFEI